jgi:hypothetical protein
MDKQPEQDHRRTPELSEWPPDTRGVSQAHYYNGVITRSKLEVDGSLLKR